MGETLSTRRSLQSILSLIILGIGGKVLGLFRNILMANSFGLTQETDAFISALSGVIIFTSLSLAVTNAIVIVYNKMDGTAQQKMRSINTILNYIIIFSILLSVLTYFFTPQIMNLFGKGFEADQYELSVYLFRVGIPVILVLNVCGCFRGYLNTQGSFVEYGLYPFALNLTMIIYIYFFADTYGIVGLMIAQVIGTATQLLIQIPYLKKYKFHYVPDFNISDRHLRELIIILAPIFISTVIEDLNVIVDKTMASELMVGSITSLDYGSRITVMFFGIIFVPVTKVLMPKMSQAYNENNIAVVNKSYHAMLTFIYLFTIPLTVGLILMAEPLIDILFGHGEFGPEAVRMSATAMVFYTVGFTAESGSLIANRVFYSMNDTKSPFYYTIVTVFLNIIFNFALIGPLDFGGLALSTSLTSWVMFIVKHHRLKSMAGYNYTASDRWCFIASCISSAVMGFAVYMLAGYLTAVNFGNVVVVLASMLAGMSVYLVLVLVLMRKQFFEIIAAFRKAN